MGFFEFSWATITLIDIGVLSVSIIGLWWLKNQVERYRVLSEELEKQNNALQQEHETLQQGHNGLLLTHENLQQEFSNFQSAADQQYNALQQEFSNFQSAADQRYNALQQEFSNFQSAADQRYNALQQEHEILKEENATLRAGLDALTREHKALQTAHDRLSGRHAELVERVMPVFEILAREKLMEINDRNKN